MVLLARKDEEGNTQTLYDHLHGAGRLASGFEDEFADISRTAAVLHDVGKVAQQFQTYLLSDDGHRGDVQHARQGAFVVNDFFESKGEIEEIAKEILELAISKHHGGLPDCIDESGNRAFLLGFTESDKSNEKYAYQEIKRGLNGLALDLQSNFRGSAEDIACFLKKIKSLGMFGLRLGNIQARRAGACFRLGGHMVQFPLETSSLCCGKIVQKLLKKN